MDLKFKTAYCALNDYEPMEVDHKYVNIYVRLTDSCNAHCAFCVYCSEKCRFNIVKFKQSVAKLLQNDIVINKVSFTGGEPTLRTARLDACVSYIREVSPDTFIVVNTNGVNIDAIPEEVDSIALSRHHYNDAINYSVFDSKILPSTMMLDMFKHKGKIHLSCNLIKGYIDSKEELYKYLEFAASVGIYDVGFVGLMNVNNYAKKHFVDIIKLNVESDRLVCNKVWHYKKSCKCKNYLYMPKAGNKLVKFYARHRCKHTTDMGSNIVFDGEHLRQNFNGKIINL